MPDYAEQERAFIEKASALFDAEAAETIRRAVEFAKAAHEGQKRDSGEPYIIHPLAVADMLLDMNLNPSAIAAGLLHDVLEDNAGITFDVLKREFGMETAELVDGVTKLTNTSLSEHTTKEEEQAETIRKMFLAMARDIRVIIIKLTDRLHNMQTLEYCRGDKRVRKAQETLDIYAPLAHRFGMGEMKSQLENLCFYHIHPEEYTTLEKQVERHRKEREDVLNSNIEMIRELIKNAGIEILDLHGRPKNLYSIYRKMHNQNLTFDQIYDLVAIRVIATSEADCYHILGLLHNHWKPLPGKIKDYIAVPKPNMYQSLHTTLMSEHGFPFEVQIRTREMHEAAEYGIAAHWKYKERREDSSDLDNKLNWLRQIMDWQSEVKDAKDFLETLKIDFFTEYVFVFSPKGNVFDLAAGSTPIDFAYRVHSAVGNKCSGARVNGKMAPLDSVLQTGDIVEILISASMPGPSLDWLRFVKTQQAKTKIKAWFRKEYKEENIEKGKDMLEREAKRLGYTFSQLVKPEWTLKLFKRLTLTTVDDLCAAVGYGGISTQQVLSRLIEEYRRENKPEPELRTIPIEKESRKGEGIVVKGHENMLVRFAKCCNPVQGDKIVGFITRGRGVSIHRQDCPNLTGLMEDAGRVIDVEWAQTETKSSYPARVHIVFRERDGFILDLIRLLDTLHIHLDSFNAKEDKKSRMNTANITFKTSNTEHLENVLKQLRKLDGAIDVSRSNSA